MCWLPLAHNLLIESYVPFQFASLTNKTRCFLCLFNKLHPYGVLTISSLYLFTKQFMWGGSCWQSKPPFLTKQYVVYGTTDPGRSPQLLGEVLILVQIMGIIHYIFIAGHEDENDYLPLTRKNAVGHLVTIWNVKDRLI